MPGGITFATDPLGPVTTTESGLMSTFTLSGRGMGFFPIRDIPYSLIHVAEKFAAEPLLASRFARHDSVGSRNDIDSKATENLRYFPARNVHAAPGTADALDVGNHLFTFRTVFQEYRQVTAGAFLSCLVVRNVTLFLQDSCDLGLQARSGHIHLRVLGLHGVPESGQHVCNGIGHGSSRCPTSST